MPPAATDSSKFTTTREEQGSPTMTSTTSSTTSSAADPKDAKDYYKAGSAEIVTETKLTVSRLEQVREILVAFDRMNESMNESAFSCM